jgi:nucleoid-associated protein YgaU
VTDRGRALALICWCALVVLLLHETEGHLPGPPLGSWAEAVRWYEEAGAPIAAMAALRLATMALATWLGLVIGLQTLAARRPRPGLARAVNAISPSWMRRLAHGMAGISLSAGLAVPTPAHADPPPVHEPPADEGTAVMRTLPEPSATSTSTTPAPAPGRGPTPETIVVVPGDSCWSIAADALADHLGHPADDRTVVTYWRRVIDANSDRFVVRGDPDLILPGQELLLPPP